MNSMRQYGVKCPAFGYFSNKNNVDSVTYSMKMCWWSRLPNGILHYQYTSGEIYNEYIIAVVSSEGIALNAEDISMILFFTLKRS